MYNILECLATSLLCMLATFTEIRVDLRIECTYWLTHWWTYNVKLIHRRLYTMCMELCAPPKKLFNANRTCSACSAHFPRLHTAYGMSVLSGWHPATCYVMCVDVCYLSSTELVALRQHVMQTWTSLPVHDCVFGSTSIGL